MAGSKKTTAKKTSKKKTTAKKAAAKSTAKKTTPVKKSSAKKAVIKKAVSKKPEVVFDQDTIQLHAYLLAEADGFSKSSDEYWNMALAKFRK